MTRRSWKRLAALCAFSALTLHGVGVLGHLHDSAAGELVTHFQHVLVLQPDLPVVDLPVLVATDRFAAEPAAVVTQPLPRLVPSRGPPA